MTSSAPDTEAYTSESLPGQDESPAGSLHYHPYPQLDALMGRLREDDPARREYGALIDEREGLFEQIAWRGAEERIRRAVAFLQSDASGVPPEPREQRMIHLLLMALAGDELTRDGWSRLLALLSAYATDPTAQLEALPELFATAPDGGTVEMLWQPPALTEATLLTFKRRYPRHDLAACVADFIAWFRKDSKTSKNADAAFLTFAKRWVY